MNEPGSNRLDEGKLIAIYEKLRAAEKNPGADYPFSDWRMEVDVDWAALERRVLRPSLPERVRDFCFAIAPRTVASSIVGPVIALVGTFYWLRSVPAEPTIDFTMQVVLGAAAMVLMFIWAAMAMQAMNRVTPLIPSRRGARGEPPALAASGSGFFTGPLRMTLGFFIVTAFVSTSVMGMVFNASSDLDERMRTHSVIGDFSRPSNNLNAFFLRRVETDPRADYWTYRAERQIRRANVHGAELSLQQVGSLENLPAVERARAEVLYGYIDARQTWQILLSTTDHPSAARAARLDAAIRNVSGASARLGSDARVLLSYLYLARAAAAEDPAERRKWSAEAIDFSLHALDAAHVMRAKGVR